MLDLRVEVSDLLAAHAVQLEGRCQAAEGQTQRHPAAGGDRAFGPEKHDVELGGCDLFLPGAQMDGLRIVIVGVRHLA